MTMATAARTARKAPRNADIARRKREPRFWLSKSRKYFGWFENRGTKGIHIELSHHSMLALARENVRRLDESLADRLAYVMAAQQQHGKQEA